MMNIVIATDNNFVQHCCVTITSVLCHNKDVRFFLFTEGLTESNTELLKRQVEKMGGLLDICLIDSKIVSKFPMPPAITGIPHITIATYYRLFVEMVLPKTEDRVLYLDCDIAVTGDLTPFYETDLSNHALAVVYQNNEWSYTYGSFKRLNIPEEEGYFNAGVLLINLDYWRKNNVTDRLFDFIKNNYSAISSHDQDVLNAVLYNEVLPVNYKWNFTPLFYNREGLKFPNKVDYTKDEKAVVIHFVSVPKPWECYCKHPQKEEYFKYLDMTPFKGKRPRFDYNWAKFNKYALKPFLLKLDKFGLLMKIKNLFKK